MLPSKPIPERKSGATAHHPQLAAHAEEDLGRYRSDTLNKLDNDNTRRKKDDEKKGGEKE